MKCKRDKAQILPPEWTWGADLPWSSSEHTPYTTLSLSHPEPEVTKDVGPGEKPGILFPFHCSFVFHVSPGCPVITPTHQAASEPRPALCPQKQTSLAVDTPVKLPRSHSVCPVPSWLTLASKCFTFVCLPVFLCRKQSDQLVK